MTTQRRPLAARLTWFPGRIGPVPTVALRYGLVALALALAAAAVVILAGGKVPFRSTVFEGTWTSLDPGDGSTQTLVVGAGKNPVVHFEDDLALGPACQFDEVKVFRADGTGEVSGDRLVASFPNGGGCGLQTVELAGTFDYEPGSETLVDQDDVRWIRVAAVDMLPTQEPTQEPTPAGTAKPTLEPSPGSTLVESTPPATVEPTLIAGCVDLSHGGTYTAPTDTLSLSVTVPSSPLMPWQGWTDAFELHDRCQDPAQITIYASTATDVVATACMSDTTPITTFADAIARLDSPRGNDISDRIDLTIDGHPAARYDVVDLTTCAAFGLWGGTLLGPGETGSIYVIDVDGTLVEIELNRDGSQTQAELDEAYAIVASLQFAS